MSTARNAPRFDSARLVTNAPIDILALKADGSPHRWLSATLEEAGPAQLVTFDPAGALIHSPGGIVESQFNCRTFFWPDKLFNVIEIYEVDMRPVQLYAQVSSLPWIADSTITYCDYELDVTKSPGSPPEVIDQDEFTDAVVRYAYSAELQRQCRNAAADASELLSSWRWRSA